jgi:Tol biopolymer transport system component
MNRLSIIAAFFALVFIAGHSALAQSAYDLFQKGLIAERTEGNLEEAIRLYKQIVAEHKDDRALVAKALVQMGGCYEKLGRVEARKAYERVIQEFADQAEPVQVAREHLQQLDGETGAGNENNKSGVTVRQVWEPSPGPWMSDSSGAPSPDGRYLSFTHWSYGNLAVRDLASGECRDLTDEGTWDGEDQWAGNSIFSPDGKQVAYAWSNVGVWELRIVGFDGSKPRVLYRNEELTNGHPNAIMPCAWSQDGRNILVRFFKRPEPGKQVWEFALVSVADGSVRILKSLTRYNRFSVLSLSPNGRYVAYAHRAGDIGWNLDIFLLSTDGSGREVVLEGHPALDVQPVWTPDGKGIVFLSNRSGSAGLWLMRVTDGRPVGEAQLLKGDIRLIRPMGFTRDGALFYTYRNNPGSRNVFVASIDPSSGKLLSPPEKAIRMFEGSNESPAWSPDGKSLAYVSQRRLQLGSANVRRRILVIRDLESGHERELDMGRGFRNLGFGPYWSPDGRSILFGGNLQLIDVQTGEVTLLVKVDPGADTRIRHAAWSADGKAIFYGLQKPGNHALMRYDLETHTEKEVPAPGKYYAFQRFSVSPDGQQIALRGLVDKKRTLMVMPAAGGESRILLRRDNEEDEGTLLGPPVWTPDGRYLLFKNGTESTSELWCIPVEGGEPKKVLTMEGLGRISMHPDGRRIALGCHVWSDQVWALENFLPEPTAGK